MKQPGGDGVVQRSDILSIGDQMWFFPQKTQDMSPPFWTWRKLRSTLHLPRQNLFQSLLGEGSGIRRKEKSPRNFIQRTRSIDEMLELFVDFEMNQRYFVFVVVHDDVSEPGKNFQRTPCAHLCLVAKDKSSLRLRFLWVFLWIVSCQVAYTHTVMWRFICGICMLSDSLVDSFAVRVSFQFHIVLLGNCLIFLKQRQPNVY